MAKRFESVEEYVASFPPEVQERLRAMREIVRAAAPGAAESISHGMPTYRLDGRAVVHFAAWTHYISVYPTPEGDAAFEKELEPYRATRSTARLPHDRPLPLDLVTRIVELLVARRASGA